MKSNNLSIAKPKEAVLLYFLGLIGLFSYAIISQPALTSIIFLLIGLTLGTIFLYDPTKGTLLLLLIRPSIDKINQHLSLHLNDHLVVNAAAALGLLIVVVTTFFLIKNYPLIKSIPLKKGWILFLLIIFFSLFYSLDFTRSIYELIRLLSIFSFFILIYCFLQTKTTDYREIIKVIIFSTIIPCLFAVYQLLTDSGLADETGANRVFGTFSHPNPFSLFCLIVLALGAFMFIHQRKESWQSIFYLIFTAGLTLLILFTFTRGIWLALMLLTFILGLKYSPKTIFYAGALGLILFFSVPAIHDRVEDIYNPPADSSIAWRIKQWQRMFDAFTKQPILGYGAGTEAVVHEKEYGFYAGNPYTHNDYLKIALENGVIGLASYLILILTTFILLIKNYLCIPNSKTEQKQLVFLILTLFFTISFFAFGDNVIRSTVNQWIIWSLIAIAVLETGSKKLETKS